MPLKNFRVVDPVLSTHARGYKNPDVRRAGGVLFPDAPIKKRGAKVVKFGKEGFRLYNTERAAGTKKKRVRVGYTDGTVNLTQYALSGEVPFEHLEESADVPNVDMARRAVDAPSESIAREKEFKQAEIAQDNANYAVGNKVALSTGDHWDEYATSDPGVQVDAGHAAIRSKIGRRGNVMVLGPNVHTKVKRHPKILGHFYSGVKNGPATVNDAQLAEYFGVREIAIGDDVYMAGNALDTDDFSDIWGDVAILAFVPTVSGEGNVEVPSYGYTYFLEGNPHVAAPRADLDSDVWVYDVKDEYEALLTGMEAGYLIENVLS